MGPTYILIFLFHFVSQCTRVFGDSFTYDPNIQYQGPIANVDNRPLRQFPVNPQFRPPTRNSVAQPILHTGSSTSQGRTPVENEKGRSARNYTLSELMEAFNELAEHQDEPEERSTTRDYEYPPYGYRPPPYGYPTRPIYGPYAPPSYHEPAYGPPAHHPYTPQLFHHSASKISLLKPALDLVKPVTTKVASKVSGLIGLVLALLTGSAPDDLELKGFKDIVVNGIVKPLLLAKGGIKTLISKLTIPVISLLLINLEVLITVWWLWEDCPEPVHHPPPYSYPRPNYNYNYNNY